MKKSGILREHYRSILYSQKDWSLLKSKRVQASKLLKIFVESGFNPYIYGSLARGDVNINSDVDIIFTQLIPTYRVEYLLNKIGLNNYFREIIMATPKDSLKIYYYLSELETITVPLSKFDKLNLEFYDFGGKINLSQIKNNVRVPGINKRLIMIKPNHQGHLEYSIIGNEPSVAKELKISLKTINERKKVMVRREKYGRTGVFLKKPIPIKESTENALKALANQKSIVRKKLNQR